MGGGRPKILAIDDIPSNLVILASALAAEFAFQLASSGQAGLDMAEAAPPDLILLDVMMPEMDGFETCRRIKANPVLAHIPVIFVTALSDEGSELNGLNLGAADYLHKPIQIDIARQRIRNLLEREMLRREVEEHRDHLEDLVSSRTVELIHARDASDAANRAKSAFLANMSHELRTPLGIILGLNNLLSMRLTEASQKDKCQKIAAAGTQLLSMIDDILNVSKMEADQVEPGRYAFSPETLLKLVMDRFSSNAQKKGLSISIAVDPAIPKLLVGAPTRIKQVMEHFLSNAIKFSDSGHITLRVIQESLCADAHHLRFEVQDQGLGIEQQQRNKLFQAFSMVDDSTSRRHGGLGIGLALSRHLAETMHGSIGMESEPGKGSRFWMCLQLSQSGSVEPDPALFDATTQPMPTAPVVETPGTTWASAEFGTKIERLSALLIAGDMQALRVWDESQALLRAHLGARADSIASALNDFEFERALELLRAALKIQRHKPIGR